MYETDLAWAAGFMDGDGTFLISLIGGYFTVQISACGRDARPIVHLKEILGGRVYQYTSKPGKDFSSTPTTMYTWRCTNKEAFDICAKLLPYLVLKKEQVECIVELGQLRRQGRKLTDEIKLQQAILCVKCSELKRLYIGLAATTEREGLHESEVCNSLDCKDDKLAEAAEMPAHLISKEELRS